MTDITMMFLSNHGFSIGNDLNSGTVYTPVKREVTREPRSYDFCSSDAVGRNVHGLESMVVDWRLFPLCLGVSFLSKGNFCEDFFTAGGTNDSDSRLRPH